MQDQIYPRRLLYIINLMSYAVMQMKKLEKRVYCKELHWHYNKQEDNQLLLLCQLAMLK